MYSVYRIVISTIECHTKNPAAAHLSNESQNDVCIERSLMSFIEHHNTEVNRYTPFTHPSMSK